ncbi:hypothetical protein SL1157_1513 [Ruegeria lacuscaerulensis ITI-1157]|nr:hypothetical protein SL1157_1513 [Ruegeria lacuscaerulensis ITI-1157]
MKLILGKVRPDDAIGMAAVLADRVVVEKRRKNGKARFVLHLYIAHPRPIRCMVASTHRSGSWGPVDEY